MTYEEMTKGCKGINDVRRIKCSYGKGVTEFNKGGSICEAALSEIIAVKHTYNIGSGSSRLRLKGNGLILLHAQRSRLMKNLLNQIQPTLY